MPLRLKSVPFSAVLDSSLPAGIKGRMAVATKDWCTLDGCPKSPGKCTKRVMPLKREGKSQTYAELENRIE